MKIYKIILKNPKEIFGSFSGFIFNKKHVNLDNANLCFL